MSKETLRNYLIASASGTTPSGRGDLLSCYTNASSQENTAAQRALTENAARALCSEQSLQSWFDPLDIQLDAAVGQMVVAFPHVFFSIRFFNLFQSVFEDMARKLWGRHLTFRYQTGSSGLSETGRAFLSPSLPAGSTIPVSPSGDFARPPETPVTRPETPVRLASCPTPTKSLSKAATGFVADVSGPVMNAGTGTFRNNGAVAVPHTAASPVDRLGSADLAPDRRNAPYPSVQKQQLAAPISNMSPLIANADTPRMADDMSDNPYPPENPTSFNQLPGVLPTTGLHPALGNPLPFGEEWTFDTFIANGKYKWALGLAREITRKTVHRVTHLHYYGTHSPQSGDPEETPGLLVLCGPHGTGKTHLLRAIGNELFRTLGEALFYASLSDLEMRFATESPLVLRQELASKSAILLDDFQHLARIPSQMSAVSERAASPVHTPLFYAPQSSQQSNLTQEIEQEGMDRRQECWGNPSFSQTPSHAAQSFPHQPGSTMQEELCLLFDRFMDQGKPVIVAGVGHPKDWNLDRALSSRLETGLWAELPEPDLDVRLRYAQQQAKLRRLALPREHLLLLAQHCPDIRRLSGVIRRVASHRSLLGRDLSEQDLLNIVRQSGDSSELTPQLIVSIVGEHCGVPAKEILGEKRRPDLVQARQIAMYLCRELLGHSYPVIGRMFGGKDHSTVMHGVKKIKQLQERDRLTHTIVTELTKTCLERRG